MKVFKVFSKKMNAIVTFQHPKAKPVYVGNVVASWSNSTSWSQGTYWSNSSSWSQGTYWTNSTSWSQGTYWSNSTSWSQGTYWSNSSSWSQGNSGGK